MKKYTSDQYSDLLSTRNIVPAESYSGMNTKICHKCLVCQHTWHQIPGAIIRGHGCPNCYRRRISKPLSVVQYELANLGWELAEPHKYMTSDFSPSQEPLLFRHICGNIIKSNIDRALRSIAQCRQCNPKKIKEHWSKPVIVNNRHYYSQIEMICSEYIIEKYGIHDIILHKQYNYFSKLECDIYIKSIDTYIEISTINKIWYLERIYKKRQLVNNFIFVSSLEQLKSFLQ